MRKLKVGDMFCGAGGTSHGLVNSDFAEVVWAINHDPKCIEAHKKNHPDTKHYEEDIVSMNIDKLCEVDLLWASLECTHFSGAKGGQSRDADSRMLARQMYRYIRKTNPYIVVIENVREFLSWGPLIVKTDKKGNVVYEKKRGELLKDDNGDLIPVMVADPKRKKESYNEWVATIKAMGFDYDYKMINSADHGARTSRNRYFGVFVRKGMTISFPKPTHSKDGSNGLPKHLGCGELINLEHEGESIFGRAYNEKLPKNVRKPLVPNSIERIVAGIKKYCIKGDLIYDHNFIMQYYGNGFNGNSLNKPLNTITTKDRHLLVSIEKEQFITEHFGTTRPVDKPIPTIMAYKDQKYMVTLDKASFITDYNYSKINSLEKPLNTITTHDKMAVATLEKAQFIQQYFSSGSNPGSQVQSLDKPLWANTTIPKGNLVTLNTSLEYLIDVKTRFLTADELKVLQGFDPSYELIGAQSIQKKAVGNSVVPIVAQAIIEELWFANHQNLYNAA